MFIEIGYAVAILCLWVALNFCLISLYLSLDEVENKYFKYAAHLFVFSISILVNLCIIEVLFLGVLDV